MRAVKLLSVIGLAAYLVAQGLYSIAGASLPITHGVIGIIGLVSGILMFISLSHWSDHHHHDSK